MELIMPLYSTAKQLLAGRIANFRKNRRGMTIFREFVDEDNFNLADAEAGLGPTGPPKVSVGRAQWKNGKKLYFSWDGLTTGWGPEAKLHINEMLLEQYEFLREVAYITTPSPSDWTVGGVGPTAWKSVLELCERKLEAVLLHEMIHWANPLEKHRPSARDKGAQFERKLYGQWISSRVVGGWMGSDSNGIPYQLGADHSKVPVGPLPRPAPAPPRQSRVPMALSSEYVVARGDSLWKIARRFYGDGGQWRRIYDANRRVVGRNPSRILPGQRLRIPG